MATLLKGAEVNEVKEMRREALTITKISSLAGFDRNTACKFLAARVLVGSC